MIPLLYNLDASLFILDFMLLHFTDLLDLIHLTLFEIVDTLMPNNQVIAEAIDHYVMINNKIVRGKRTLVWFK